MGAALRQSVYASNEPQAEPWQEQQEAISMQNSRGAYNRKLFHDSRRNIPAPADGKECRDWLKEQLDPLPCGEIAEDAQCTKRTAENIRSGENGMRMEYLVAMCRNNPQFRAAFFEFCGGQLDMPPDLTAVIQKYMRNGAGQ